MATIAEPDAAVPATTHSSDANAPPVTTISDVPEAAAQDEPLAAEDDQSGSANDSAYGGDDDASAYSASLASSIFNHVYENGRRYHAFRAGAYLNPDDEQEQERLDINHHIWKMLIGGKTHIAPLTEPFRILDVGTGTGAWAIEAADQYESAEVIGVDISPIQPDYVPPNCKFYIDDFESPWVYDSPFDYIHARNLGGAVADWVKFHKEAFKNLKPGGWLEMQEFDGHFSCDDGTMKDDSWVAKWTIEMDKGSTKFGKNYNAAPLQKQLMTDAGYINIQTQMYKVPVGPWAKGQKMKELGTYSEANVIRAVDSFTPALYTRVLGYDMDHTTMVMDNVKREMADRKIHQYCRYHFFIGQKPEA